VIDREGFPVHLSGRLLTYIPWLTKEIAKSNWDVARIVLDPSLPISPTMQSFRVTPRTDLGKVIYANSITLTPGTITTGIIGDTFEIHALTGAAWDGTEEGEMGRRVCQLEGEV
jgi:multicomponent Na+:H+ antiporter subunit E